MKFLLACVLIIVSWLIGAFKDDIVHLLPARLQNNGYVIVPCLTVVVIAAIWLYAIGGLREDVSEKRTGWGDNAAFGNAPPQRPPPLDEATEQSSSETEILEDQPAATPVG